MKESTTQGSSGCHPNVRSLASDAVVEYFSRIDEYKPHVDNVVTTFRIPVVALTLSILKAPIAAEEDEDGSGTTKLEPGVPSSSLSSWRDYMETSNPASNGVNLSEYDSLSKRAKARLEAFVLGVSLAVPASSEEDSEGGRSSGHEMVQNKQRNQGGFSVLEGLAGFGNSNSRKQSSLMRTMSTSTSITLIKRPQIADSDLVTRLELYLRSLYRVKSLQQDCVIGAEPVRAIKARAHAIVDSFIQTVSTVRQQGPVLTRLLICLAKEVLAVECLSEDLDRVIRRIVSEYEHATSFASLAFLSSPENAADQKLTPMVLNLLRYLRSNWQNIESACELEEMMRQTLDPQMRRTFKTVEFRSIGHLLEVCQSFRSDLQHIVIKPICFKLPTDGTKESGSEAQALEQAVRDLTREVITINGHVLPPVASHADLIRMLSQTLNSQALISNLPAHKNRRRKKGRKIRRSHRGDTTDASETDGSLLSSGNETDSSAQGASAVSSSDDQGRSRNRSFKKSTIDYLTKRLLLAAGRTGTGGDAYFVVRDLFGGNDVDVVPSAMPILSAESSRRRETIEITVRLASIVIRCHGSFDVYPTSLVGSCEPLIQVHTTTSETVSLQEVRMPVTTLSQLSDRSDDSDGDFGPKNHLVVQELLTEKTGLRTLSVRPALYEKIEVLTTPS